MRHGKRPKKVEGFILMSKPWCHVYLDDVKMMIIPLFKLILFNTTSWDVSRLFDFTFFVLTNPTKIFNL